MISWKDNSISGYRYEVYWNQRNVTINAMQNAFRNSHNKYIITGFKRTYIPSLKCVCAPFYNKLPRGHKT